MANETPSRPPPPFMANAILNFHFDFPGTSLRRTEENIWLKEEKEKDENIWRWKIFG